MELRCRYGPVWSGFAVAGEQDGLAGVVADRVAHSGPELPFPSGAPGGVVAERVGARSFAKNGERWQQDRQTGHIDHRDWLVAMMTTA